MIQRKPDFARLGEPCALSASALAVADRTELRRLHPRVPHASHHTEVHALDALAGGIAVELPVTRLEGPAERAGVAPRSEEHTSELQSQSNLVCRLLLEKKKNTTH